MNFNFYFYIISYEEQCKRGSDYGKKRVITLADVLWHQVQTQFLFLFYYFWYITTTFPDLLNKNNNNM
jgi:hypothetical protein